MDQQTQINPPCEPPARKSKLWKFFFGLVAIVTATFVLLFGLGIYRNLVGQYRVQKLAEAMAQADKEEYAREMADTYGGKTPQETLAMYIAAVQEKDYVLASKYFTFGKQQQELDSWTGATPEAIATYVTLLKQGLKAEGSYSADQKGFATRKPILIDYFLYPNGIWKLTEI